MIIQKTEIKQEKWETKSKSGLFLVFIFATIMLFTGGYLYLKNEETVWRKNALKQLKNTTLLKAKQIEEWRNERRSDAGEIVQSPLFQDAVYNLINHQGKKGLKSEIEQRLQIVIQNNSDIVNILLTGDKGQTLLSGKPCAPELATTSTSKLVREVIKRNNEIFGDLYKNSQNGAIYADIGCPIFNERHEINAVILFRLNTGVSLFPILQVWPYDSTTEESFLFKKEGDSVLFMSNLRNWPNAALSLKFPLTSNENPAARAIKEGAGFYEGIGYHGQKVFEYIQPINGSAWLLASKIDRDELFKPVYKRAKTLSVILLLLFLSLSTLIYLIITYRRKHFYKQLLEDERQQAALKSHFEYVVKYANDIILLEDDQLNIIESNQRAQQTYQYSLEELSKMKITDLVAPESRQEVEIRLKNITENDGAIIESIHRRKDGTLFHVEISARIIEVDGRAYLHQVIRDITERKQAEIDLTESEERFRTTLYSTGDAIITTDINGKVRYMNPVAEELTGWKEDEAGGKPIREVFNIFDEDSREEVENPVDKVFEKGMIILLSNHTFLKSKNGNEIPIGDSGAPIRNAKGEIAGVVLIFRDQTKERLAKKALEESELHFHNLATFSPVGIFRTRPDGYTTYVNPKWCQLSGITGEKAMGDGWLTAVHPEDREKLAEGWNSSSQSRKASDAEYRFLHPDGTIVYVMGHSIPEINSENQLTGFIGTISDITDRKQAEAEQFRLLNIIEKSLNEIYVFDAITLKFEFANHGALENLGFSLEEMKELTPVDIKPEFTDETFRQVIEPLKTGLKDKLVIETIHQRKNGSSYPVEIHLQLHKTDNKSVFLAVINDITERLENINALQQSKDRWESLFNNSPNAIAVYQAVDDGNDFVFTDFNLSASKTDNLKHDEVVGKRISELFPTADPIGLLDVFRKVWRTGKTEYISSTFYKDNRIDGWRENIIYKLNTGEIVAIYNDVSDRVEAEIALRTSEETFRNYFENSPLGKSITGVDGTLNVNKAFCQMLGYSKEELLHINWKEITHPDDLQLSENVTKSLIDGEKEIVWFEKRFIHKNGDIVWTEVSSTLQKDAEGKPSYFITNINNITERKQSEKQLKLLGRAIDQNPVTIVITNTDGDIKYMNPKFTEVTGYTSGEVIGKNPRVLQSGEHSPEFYKDLWDTILSGADWHGEFHNKKKNGEHYWESAVISPVFDDSGEISSFVAVKEDITEKKKMIHDLIIAKEHAEESDRLKSSFLATMSHELRTPLNAVIGFSSLMDQEMPIEQIISFAQIINNSGKNLLEIIEGIFDLSMLESGEARCKPEQFDLLAFMNKILDIAKAEQQNAGRQQIKIIYAKTKHQEPVLLYSDQHKLTQVLTNLLKNALKFTLSGKIEFGYVIHPDGNNNKIKFFVKDTGIGIPDNRKSIVFDRFRQGDDSNTRLYGGAGIGLAVSKHTVELLGGKIWVESEVGNGSAFFVLLPDNIIKDVKINQYSTGPE